MHERVESFLEAAREGNIAELERLLHDGVDVNAANEEGSSALHFASVMERADVVAHLLSIEGINVDAPGPGGETPLCAVVDNDGDLKIISMLVEAHANIRMARHDGATPLGLAEAKKSYRMQVALLNQSFLRPKDIHIDALIERWVDLWLGEQGGKKAWYSIDGSYKEGTREFICESEEEDSFAQRFAQLDNRDGAWPPRLAVCFVDPPPNTRSVGAAGVAPGKKVKHFLEAIGCEPLRAFSYTEGMDNTFSVSYTTERSSTTTIDHTFHCKLTAGLAFTPQVISNDMSSGSLGIEVGYAFKKSSGNTSKESYTVQRQIVLKDPNRHVRLERLTNVCVLDKSMQLSGYVVVASTLPILPDLSYRDGYTGTRRCRKWAIPIAQVVDDLKQTDESLLDSKLKGSLKALRIEGSHVFCDFKVYCELKDDRVTTAWREEAIHAFCEEKKTLQDALVKHNRSGWFIQRFFFERDVSLTEHYKTLAIIDRHDHHRMLTSDHLLQHEGAFRTLILAPSGGGKSTLAKKLASEAEGWCFRIDVGSLREEWFPPRPDRPYVLGEVLIKIGLPEPLRDRFASFSENSLWLDYLQKLVVGVKTPEEERMFQEGELPLALVILDGFEENRVPDHLQDVFTQLMRAQRLIVMARLYDLRPLLNGGDHRFARWTEELEITGFSEDTIDQYIRDFFASYPSLSPDINLDEVLIAFLAEHAHLRKLCRTPVNLALICEVRAAGGFDQSISTVSELYSKLLTHLSRRYVGKFALPEGKRLDDLDREQIEEICRHCIAFAERLAFHSLESGHAIVETTVARKYLPHSEQAEAVEKQKAFGFIKQDSLREGRDKVRFNHDSFRDFFAARYIATAFQQVSGSSSQQISDPGLYRFEWRECSDIELTQQVIQRFIQAYRFDVLGKSVMPFVAGLLAQREDKKSLNLFYRCLLHDVGHHDITALMEDCLQASHRALSVSERANIKAWAQGTALSSASIAFLQPNDPVVSLASSPRTLFGHASEGGGGAKCMDYTSTQMMGLLKERRRRSQNAMCWPAQRLEQSNWVDVFTAIKGRVTGAVSLAMPIETNGHWVALFMAFEADDLSAPTVRYLDPGKGKLPERLAQSIEAVFLDADISTPRLKMAEGFPGDASGVWLVEGLTALWHKQPLPNRLFDMAEAQSAQLHALGDLAEGFVV